MAEYRTLGGTDIEILHKCFNEAFSDYSVKIEMPVWKLQNMLKRRGFAAELSIGAFDKGELVGFIFNGVRNWNGIRTGYDTGTGVIPKFRGGGLTKGAFAETLKLLRANGIKQYLLEVIKTNEPAFSLYKKQGFEITRGFACYKQENGKINAPKNCNLEIRQIQISEIDWERAKTFWDFEASWQNSIDSVLAVPETFKAFGAFENGKLVGYGIVEPRTGDVPQLAVSKEYRRKGAGSALLRTLVQSSEAGKLAFICVDEKANSMRKFLESAGFENFVEQYEMMLKIY